MFILKQNFKLEITVKWLYFYLLWWNGNNNNCLYIDNELNNNIWGNNFDKPIKLFVFYFNKIWWTFIRLIKTINLIS